MARLQHPHPNPLPQAGEGAALSPSPPPGGEGRGEGEEPEQQAFTYAYPLYEMARMRAATSPRRIPGAGNAGDTPASTMRWCNVFTHARELLGAGGSRVVTPNNDTLYSNAWLDLADGPLVIEVPDTAGRYYVLGLLDFFTNPFAHIGSRLTGTRAGSFFVTGPGWRGELPAGMTHVAAPTRWVWIIGRLLVDGPQDLPAVHALQDAFRIRAADGAASAPKRFDCGLDAKAPLTADVFAEQVKRALRDNPPPAHEAAWVASFETAGIGAGAPPLRNDQRAALAAAIDTGLRRLREADLGGRVQRGWTHMPRLEGSFGDDFERRAIIALKYIGALESREAVYPMAWHDAHGEPLDGRHDYLLRFAPGAPPPVDAFWSLTVYDSRDFMLVPNPIERYAIGDRTPGLRHDADGSLTLHLRHAEPADAAARANWLPTAAGGFYLCLRAYLPRPELLDGRYDLPAIERITR